MVENYNMPQCKILAIDTTSRHTSVAFIEDGRVVASLHHEEAERQAELLVPYIEELLKQTQMSYDLLDVIAVTIGPGSFTGIRIGLATARGVGLAARKPVIGVSGFESIMQQVFMLLNHPCETPIACVLDARRGQIYLQLFDKTGWREPLDEPQLLSFEQALTYLHHSYPTALLVGDISDQLADYIEHSAQHLAILDAFIQPEAETVGLVAYGKYQHLINTEALITQPAPLYIRSPDAKKP